MKEYHKICKFCGKEFTTFNPHTAYCDSAHYDICVVCGKQFEVPRSRLSDSTRSKTCSKECRTILRKNTCMSKYGGPAPACSKDVQLKAQATCLSHWGTRTPAENLDIQAKMQQTQLERTGYAFTFQNPESVQKSKETCLQKYGAESFTQTAEFLEKSRQTSQERYGTDNPAQSEEVRRKMSETYKSRTGYTTPFSNPEVQDKVSQTNLQKYGTKRVMQSEYGKRKSKETCLQRYGTENPMQNELIQKKAEATTLRKYGSKCYFSSEEGKFRIRQIMQSKYGVDYFSSTPAWKQSVMRDPSKLANLLAFQDNPKDFILNHLKGSKPSISMICDLTGTGGEAVQLQLNRHDCNDLVKHDVSTMECEVVSFLKSVCPNILIIQNTKKVIAPYELDIYLPEYNLAIECNPTATHNSSFSMFGTKENVLSKNYHKMKSNMCIDKNIQLFHIFGYEWTHKRTVIQSMLCNLLHKNTSVVYGRNTYVQRIDASIAYAFLRRNHRQGMCPSAINLGLYTNDNELVSVMTFGNIRYTMGRSAHTTTSDEYELLRFCSKLDTTVMGGASKLFKYFCNNYTPTSIRSYSDIAHTSGKLYSTLGFKQIQISEPGYVWVNVKTDKSYHRINAQKRHICKFLHDYSIDLAKTEQQIMEEHGFVWVYDSGTILWVWKPDKHT